MLCWKCKKEMICEYRNPWKINKAGDFISSGTFVCWDCRTILKVNLIEVDHRDICDDDVPEKVR